MSPTSALRDIHTKGLFGDYEGKNESELLNIIELSDLLIVQIVKYKKSSILNIDIQIDNLNFNNEALSVDYNNNTRVLWNGPNNWLLVSTKKEILNEISEKLKETDFAITNLSHSRTIIQIEGKNTKEILKKGCPFNFNDLKKNNSLNSSYNGMSVTIDILDDKIDKIRIFTLRSFGESLYHSITDACLEYGYKSL
tara:strand:- start:361 stop:948 length:588 start_codon:yes stop_codon:yes gene_type:complete